MPVPSSTVTKSASTTRFGARVDREEVERSLVVPADEIGDARPGRRLGVTEHVGDARGGEHDVATASGAHPHVLDVGADGRGDVPRHVHGVVVHTSRSKSASTTGKRT